MGTVGIIVNPSAGTDVRRLVGGASAVSDAARIGLVRRAVAGAVHGGATRVLIGDDHRHLGRRAIDRMERGGAAVEVIGEGAMGDRTDTVAAAAGLAKREAGAVVVFGGDGTNRDVVAGWPDATLVPVSSGTNNVFPLPIDAGVAGTVAALIAGDRVGGHALTRRAKRIAVHVCGPARPDHDDVALVDVALVAGRFTGSRAVWDPGVLRAVVAAIGHPTAVGLSSLAGRVAPVGRWELAGRVVEVGPGGRSIEVPLVAGTYVTVPVSRVGELAIGEPVRWHGAGVVALDGERSIVLHDGDRVEVSVRDDGPFVADVEATMLAAVSGRWFDHDPTETVDVD